MLQTSLNPNTQHLIMKTIISLVLFVFSFTVTRSATATTETAEMTSFVDVNANASRDRSHLLQDTRYVVASAAPSVSSLSFGTKITLPAEATSFQFTSGSFSITSVVNGITRNHSTNVSMSLFKWRSPEITAASRPFLFATDVNRNTINVPTNAPFTTPVANPSIIWITEQAIVQIGSPTPFPKLSNVGDKYTFTITLSYSYVVDGLTTTVTAETTEAKGVVVTNLGGFLPTQVLPAEDLKQYPTVALRGEGGETLLQQKGLNESWQYNYLLEESDTLFEWDDSNVPFTFNSTTGIFTFTIPVLPGVEKRFWRFRGVAQGGIILL